MLYAQQREIDSLESVLPKTKKNLERAEVLYQLAGLYRDVNVDTALVKASALLQLARKEKNDSLQFKAHIVLGKSLLHKSNLDSANFHYKAAAAFLNTSTSYTLKSTLWINRGILFFYQSNYQAAQQEFEKALEASEILFGKSTSESLKKLDEQTFLDVFDGVTQATVSSEDFSAGLDMIGALAAKTKFLKSNGDARRALKENSISVNKEKVKEDYIISSKDLIAEKYVLLQRGKKTYFLLKVE